MKKKNLLGYNFANTKLNFKQYNDFIQRGLEERNKSTICEQLKNPLQFNSLREKLRFK